MSIHVWLYQNMLNYIQLSLYRVLLCAWCVYIMFYICIIYTHLSFLVSHIYIIDNIRHNINDQHFNKLFYLNFYGIVSKFYLKWKITQTATKNLLHVATTAQFLYISMYETKFMHTICTCKKLFGTYPK